MKKNYSLPAAEDQKLIVFLAEDDEDDASLFEDAVLHFSKHASLTIHEDGHLMMEALLKKTVTPDIIFLDLNMPRKSGLECLKEIKGDKDLTLIKTVILSTTSDENQIRRCFDLGADRFLTKPSSIKTLRTFITECLESVSAQNKGLKN
ncbi:response regulator [Sphingobacteriaceae bacterium]|nr:response regulator [Sphingobacteriaceae bacterium]